MRSLCDPPIQSYCFEFYLLLYSLSLILMLGVTCIDASTLELIDGDGTTGKVMVNEMPVCADSWTYDDSQVFS